MSHAQLTGRWLLRLLSHNEFGSREEFQLFVKNYFEKSIFDYNLNVAMHLIDSGDLPNWAHYYFVDPPNEQYALVANTARCWEDFYANFYWQRNGHSNTEIKMINWIQDGGTESWTEWLMNAPCPL